MRWTARTVSVGIQRVASRVVLACGAVVLVSGCQMMTNPYVDDYADGPSIETPSVAGVRAAQTTPAVVQRGFAAVTAEAVDGSVTHTPLLFEDGFADTWTDDGTFAWTGEDWIQWMTWRARFFVNMAAVPYSWVTTPPWTVMESDGYPSRCLFGEHYDADLR